MKRFGITFIRIASPILAVTCATKLALLYYDLPLFVKVVNIIFNAYFVCGIYALGVLFGCCLLHRIMCCWAAIGYLLYSIYLTLGMARTHWLVEPVVIGHCSVMACLLIIYFISKCRCLRKYLQNTATN